MNTFYLHLNTQNVIKQHFKLSNILIVPSTQPHFTQNANNNMHWCASYTFKCAKMNYYFEIKVIDTAQGNAFRIGECVEMFVKIEFPINKKLLKI